VWISSMTTSRQTSWLFLLYIIYYCSSSTSTYFTPYTIIRSVHCGDPYYPSNNKRGTQNSSSCNACCGLACFCIPRKYLFAASIALFSGRFPERYRPLARFGSRHSAAELCVVSLDVSEALKIGVTKVWSWIVAGMVIGMDFFLSFVLSVFFLSVRIFCTLLWRRSSDRLRQSCCSEVTFAWQDKYNHKNSLIMGDFGKTDSDPLETAKWTRYLPESFGIREAVRQSSYRWCVREGYVQSNHDGINQPQFSTATAVLVDRCRIVCVPTDILPFTQRNVGHCDCYSNEFVSFYLYGSRRQCCRAFWTTIPYDYSFSMMLVTIACTLDTDFGWELDQW
jgi:hypothetical protein